MGVQSKFTALPFKRVFLVSVDHINAKKDPTEFLNAVSIELCALRKIIDHAQTPILSFVTLNAKPQNIRLHLKTDG